MNHFERLGLPFRYSLDPAAIEREYLARSRAIHPDFHQLGSNAEQSASVELSASLNEAYATLKDPFRRGEYLLSLAGGPTASDVKDVPMEFLDEMLELRMEIAGLEADSPAAEAMEQQLTTRRDAILAEAGQPFDAGDVSDARKLEIRRRLNAVKYLVNLIRDLRAL